jgi:hypothetical protein
MNQECDQTDLMICRWGHSEHDEAIIKTEV